MEDMIKMFMPVIKQADGKFAAILSDDSMDRDEEFMSKELIDSWAQNTSLKALANHENKMQTWVGGWRNLKSISKGERTALIAEPWFFSAEANPLAAQIQKQVEEALENGEAAGISIGAIPKESIQKEINGKKYKVYTKAELVEATWVPIQSNRNATFGHVAKAFGIMEENKMVEEEIKKEDTPNEEITPSEEVVEEPVDAVAEKEVAVEEEDSVDDSEVEELQEEIKNLKAELEKVKADFSKKEVELKTEQKKGVLKATVETIPNVKTMEMSQVVNKELTVEDICKFKLGGKLQ